MTKIPNKAGTLVFTACYNERDNIGLLIEQIVENVPEADILVVDDNSPDGTWDVIEQKKQQHGNLYSIKRPRKLGIGSAHKYAIFYAIREGYETLVTMDADFSHDPKAIPDLLALHDNNVFVTGSRYCEGGSSDYSGYRDIVSRMGNVAARWALGVNIKELTTYFRVFDVKTLGTLPLRYISSAGYSYGVELIYYLRKCGVILREVPIHFTDRTRGASKIPKFQIFKSAYDLLGLALGRLWFNRDLKPEEFVSDSCLTCGDKVLASKSPTSRQALARFTRSKILRNDEGELTDKGHTSRIYACLRCGLEQTVKCKL